jgi:hypothetical protein
MKLICQSIGAGSGLLDAFQPQDHHSTPSKLCKTLNALTGAVHEGVLL